ncbi:MAG TPA: sulfotransferase domain-containing protein [Azospirillaceae bacterium]|nr:sulfotransferase domain-containing protein [Azospirillaceae bacterium]
MTVSVSSAKAGAVAGQSDRPLALLTQFKSGTWLTRRIVEGLTGMSMVEPDYGHAVGLDPEDATHIFHCPGRYYSWHALPVPPVREKLRAMNARVVLQIRNVYDMAVSQYHHYADDIDREFQRGAGRAAFFGSVTRDFGLAVIVAGYNGEGFVLPGFGDYLRQTELMIDYAETCPDCLLLSYEDVVRDRVAAIRRVARHLEIDIDDDQAAAMAQASSFSAMRRQGEAAGTTSHFRKGGLFRHGEELNQRHAALMRLEIARYAPNLPARAAAAGMAHVLEFHPASPAPFSSDGAVP